MNGSTSWSIGWPRGCVHRTGSPRTAGSTEDAADYFGFESVDPLHKLTAARRIEFSQEGPGAKTWFRRSALDDYRGNTSMDR